MQKIEALSNLELLIQEGGNTRAGSETFAKQRDKSQHKFPAQVFELVS